MTDFIKEVFLPALAITLMALTILSIVGVFGYCVLRMVTL